jgi:hypothetical protein
MADLSRCICQSTRTGGEARRALRSCARLISVRVRLKSRTTVKRRSGHQVYQDASVSARATVEAT